LAAFLIALWQLIDLLITAERGGMPQRFVSYYYPF
jgi:hypothetical protein